MAWQAYVDSLKGYYPEGVAACGIFGTNGSTWAHEGLQHVSTNYTELISACSLYDDASAAFANGFDFNGEKFVLIKIDEDVLNAKSKGEQKQPLTIQKCNTCMVIMLGKSGANGGSISIAVSKMANHLKEHNY